MSAAAFGNVRSLLSTKKLSVISIEQVDRFRLMDAQPSAWVRDLEFGVHTAHYQGLQQGERHVDVSASCRSGVTSEMLLQKTPLRHFLTLRGLRSYNFAVAQIRYYSEKEWEPWERLLAEVEQEIGKAVTQSS